MKLYSETTILKRLESLSITYPAIFFDGMEEEKEQQKVDDQFNFMMLDVVTKLVAAKVANYGHCDDEEVLDCFKLSSKIITFINNKNLQNDEKN